MAVFARVRRATRRPARARRRGWLAAPLLLAACTASEVASDTAPPPVAVRPPEPPASQPELGPEPGPELPQAAREFAARDAETVQRFAQACATCHGLDGSGTGPLVLERPARDLRGGFSFGNTTEAIARTIVAGIPGTPMPAFGESFTPAAIAALAAYVQALGPPPRAEDDQPAELTVASRAAVVRGLLPPIAQGARSHPRGLLVGLPGGLSFEYRADDLSLLGVRFGRFVRRTDWRDRGGTPLEPLGRLVLPESAAAQDTSSWQLATAAGAPARLRTRLVATHTTGAVARLHGELVDSHGRCVARLTESLAATASGKGLLWTRRFTIGPVDWKPGEELHLLLAGPRDTLAPLAEDSAQLPRGWLAAGRRTLGGDGTALMALRGSGSAPVALDRFAQGGVVRLSRPEPGERDANGGQQPASTGAAREAALELELVTLLVSGTAAAPAELLAEVLP